MKRILLLALILFGLAGCDKNDGVYTPPSEPADITSEVVPVAEALERLSAFQNAIMPSTRSGKGGHSAKSIRDISVSGGGVATRSGGCVELPDTMVYIVNFTDNEGYAVLAARRSLEPIYAVTESGSFEAEKLDETIARLSLECAQDVSPAPTSESYSFNDVGLDYVYELMAAGLINSANRSGLPPIGGWGKPGDTGTTIFLGYTDWEIKKKVGPQVTVKWNQTHPFNMSMDRTWSSDTDIYYKNRYPAGCGVIAMAQIMTSVKKPAMAPAGKGIVYDWENLKTVSNYENVRHFQPGHYTNYNIEYARQLADVLYHLGICFGRQYFNGQTIVDPYNVIIGLKNLDANYYANAVFDVIDSEKFYAQLDKGKPLFMIGKIETGAGHAWVVDGYINALRYAQYVFKEENKEDLYMNKYDYGYFIHVNWGYSGAADGYYSRYLFDMNEREFKDEVIDENIVETPGLNLNLSIDNRVIYY